MKLAARARQSIDLDQEVRGPSPIRPGAYPGLTAEQQRVLAASRAWMLVRSERETGSSGQFEPTHCHQRWLGERPQSPRYRERGLELEGAAVPGGRRGNSDCRSTERRRDWRPRLRAPAISRPPGPAVPIVLPQFAAPAVPIEASSQGTVSSTTSWVGDRRSTRQRTFGLALTTPTPPPACVHR